MGFRHFPMSAVVEMVQGHERSRHLSFKRDFSQFEGQQGIRDFEICRQREVACSLCMPGPNLLALVEDKAARLLSTARKLA